MKINFKRRIAICLGLSVVLGLAACDKIGNSSESVNSIAESTAASEHTEREDESGGSSESIERTNETKDEIETSDEDIKKETSEAESNSESSVNDEESSQSIDYESVLEPLLTALNDIDCIAATSVNFDESDKYTDEIGYEFYRVVDSRFSSVADLDAYLNKYLTESMRSKQFSYIIDDERSLYIEHDGKLYVSSGGRGCGFEWLDNPAKISDVSEGRFTAVKEYDEFGNKAEIELKIVNTSDGWKIDNFVYLV